MKSEEFLQDSKTLTGYKYKKGLVHDTSETSLLSPESSSSFLAHSYMCAHAQAMNEYRGDEVSTDVVVDGNLWTEIVDRRRK